MSTSQKLISIFSATVIGIIRVYSLKNFGLTADPTWDNIPTIFWSTLETTSAVFCACMPAMRAGLVRLFPKVFGGASFFKSTVTSTSWGSKVTKSTRDAVHKRWLSHDRSGQSGNESIMLSTKQGDNFVRLAEEPSNSDWGGDSKRSQPQTNPLSKNLPSIPLKE